MGQETPCVNMGAQTASGVTQGMPMSTIWPMKYSMKEGLWEITVKSVVSYRPTAMASISRTEMPP